MNRRRRNADCPWNSKNNRYGFAIRQQTDASDRPRVMGAASECKVRK